MAIVVLFLLSSTILVQGYGKSNDPNDEPFLPIYPVYPYSPKLIKRGADREAITQLSPELYAPKLDAKDSYSASYSTNYPRDPYYPNYNPYPKTSSSPSGYSYYGSLPYTYPTSTYSGYNSYSTPYSVAPPSYSSMPYSASYPNYYYQQPYYYPSYYPQPLYGPSPPPPPPGADYSSDTYSDSESAKSKEKKSSGEKRYKDSDGEQESANNQYVDGGNYISGNLKDLDSQPSTYKSSSPQNQLEQITDLHLKNIPIPIPKTTYRVVSVAGQPVGPDYPLPAPYVKAQQIEELMSQTWAKMIAQNLQQASQHSMNSGDKSNGGQYMSQNDQNKESQRYISVPNVIAKAGLAYVVNPSILGKLNIGNVAGQVAQTTTTHLKNIKYPPPISGVYTAMEKPTKDQLDSNEYENYENSSPQGSQDYDSSLSQNEKQPQNYENDQSYQNQNYVTVQTPRGYSYQYSSYNPSQATGQQQQQYKTNLDDVNFGSKTKKG